LLCASPNTAPLPACTTRCTPATICQPPPGIASGTAKLAHQTVACLAAIHHWAYNFTPHGARDVRVADGSDPGGNDGGSGSLIALKTHTTIRNRLSNPCLFSRHTHTPTLSYSFSVQLSTVPESCKLSAIEEEEEEITSFQPHQAE